MIDSTTKQPIQVRAHDPSLPGVVVPATQLDQVRHLLEANGVRFWVDRHQISFDGLPPVAFIEIARGTDPAWVQSILDTVP
jgi:hypothetical protein